MQAEIQAHGLQYEHLEWADQGPHDGLEYPVLGLEPGGDVVAKLILLLPELRGLLGQEHRAVGFRDKEHRGDES